MVKIVDFINRTALFKIIININRYLFMVVVYKLISNAIYLLAYKVNITFIISKNKPILNPKKLFNPLYLEIFSLEIFFFFFTFYLYFIYI